MLRIDKQKTLELYMQEINEMAELMDWVDALSPGDVVRRVCSILERYPELITKREDDQQK